MGFYLWFIPDLWAILFHKHGWIKFDFQHCLLSILKPDTRHLTPDTFFTQIRAASYKGIFPWSIFFERFFLHNNSRFRIKNRRVSAGSITSWMRRLAAE